MAGWAVADRLEGVSEAVGGVGGEVGVPSWMARL